MALGGVGGMDLTFLAEEKGLTQGVGGTAPFPALAGGFSLKGRGMLYFLRRGGQCRSRSGIVARRLAWAINRFDDESLQTWPNALTQFQAFLI
jgi:hypothetical protein